MATTLQPIKRADLAPRPLLVRDLGVIPYAGCWDLQNTLAASLAKGEGQETLLLLEHPHTYTCGRKGGRDHILISEEELRAEGVTVLDVDRGGDVTYHGPGQLVAYPIFRLAPEGEPVDYPGYVRSLEKVLIGTAVDFGIEACQIASYSGAWTRSEWGEELKLAAIGVKVDGRGITTHGIALNVDTDLHYFTNIIPCGITGKGVTSMRLLLGQSPSMNEVKASFVKHFARTFGFYG